MQRIQVDGLAVLPELMDDAILVSNLLEKPVRGREKIRKVILVLENHYVSVSDIERINTASHRIIESVARLPSGQRVRSTVVGTREDNGWISEVLITLEPEEALGEVTRLVREAVNQTG